MGIDPAAHGVNVAGETRSQKSEWSFSSAHLSQSKFNSGDFKKMI